MDRTGIDGNYDVGDRSVEIQIETEEVVSARRERKMQMADSVLKCLSPLIVSMKALGIYFTRELANPTDVSQNEPRCVGGRCREWSRARIYATILLVVTWINTTRYCIVINGTETVGDLFLKLGVISGILLNAFLHTAYYVASHTGSLNRVFRQVDLFEPDFRRKYSRRVNIATVVCWLLTVTGMIYYVYITFGKDYFNDLFTVFLVKTFRLSIQRVSLYIAKAVCVVLQLPSIAVFGFTQAMNYRPKY